METECLLVEAKRRAKSICSDVGKLKSKAASELPSFDAAFW